MAKLKYNQETVEKFFKEHNCELISEYKDVKSEIEYICSCREKSKTTFDGYRNSKHKKCKKCSSILANEDRLLDIEYVKQYFKEQGCELLEKEYVNSKTKMKYICNCGEVDNKTWNNFRQGQRCNKCAIKKRSENQRLSNQEVNDFLSKHGFELLDNYIDIHAPLKHKCTCGNVIWHKSLATLKENPKCTCIANNIPKNLGRRYKDNELVELFWKFYKENNRYPLTSDFINDETYPSPYTYTKRWGSWDNFLKEISVIRKDCDDGWYIHDEQVLLKMYENEEDKDKIIDSLMIKRSWSTIQHKANNMGLKRSYKVKYGLDEITNDELLEILLKVNNENLNIPLSRVFQENDNLPSSHIYRHRFGSWNNALNLVGIDPLKVYKKLNNKELEDIKNMYLNGIQTNVIAEKYGYTDGASIYYQLHKMGVRLKRNTWNENKIEYLKSNYADESWDNILYYLNPIKKEGIMTKASELGLKRNINGNLGENKIYYADNGEICLSYSEYLITNIIFLNNIEYEKEVFYCDILNDKSVGRIRCDWMIRDIVVEYFGLCGILEYKEKTQRKINLCKENNIKMIKLYPQDLDYNFKGLLRKFKEHGIILELPKVA